MKKSKNKFVGPRFLIKVCCVVLLAAMVSACGKNESSAVDTNSSTEPSSTSEIQESAPPQGGKTEATQTDVVVKSTNLEIDGKSKILSVDLPAYIAEFVTLQVEPAGETVQVLFLFSSGENTANIGIVTVMPQKVYDEMKAESGPMPDELFTTDDGITVAFQGLQSAPFDTSTDEGKLVDRYQMDSGNVIKSVKLA